MLCRRKYGPGISVIAWTHVRRRQEGIAALLGADTIIVDSSGSRNPRILQYARAAVLTSAQLLRLRPAAVLVSAPPIPAAVVVYGMSLLLGFRFGMDSHPGAFGLMGDKVSKCLGPVHKYLVRRAAYVAVTTEALVEEVSRMGGTGGLLHEPPAPAMVDANTASNYVLFPGSGGRDEPYELVMDVARAVPRLKFIVTGTPRHDLGSIPENVRLVGWVPVSRFEALLHNAKVVLALSLERESVMRTAYESCYALRRLVVSRTPATKRFFPIAIHVSNDVAAVCEGLRASTEVGEEGLLRQREVAIATWDSQLAMLRSELLGGGLGAHSDKSARDR